MSDQELRYTFTGDWSSLKRSVDDMLASFRDLDKQARTAAAGIASIGQGIKSGLGGVGAKIKSDVVDPLKNLSMEVERAKNGLKSIVVTTAGFTTAMGAALAAPTKAFADFESQLNSFRAVSSATIEEMKQFEAMSLSLGQATSKSASEIAKAGVELTKMGLSATQAMQAMPGIISGAEAAGESLDKVSGVVVSVMNGFRMEASDAQKIVDVLAKTANLSATSISEMGVAFQYTAAVGKIANQSFESVSTALGIVTNSGIQASAAGNQLQNMFTRLSAPPKAAADVIETFGLKVQTAEGKLKAWPAIMEELRSKFVGLSDTKVLENLKDLFGDVALPSAAVLFQTTGKEIDDFEAKLMNAGGSAEETAKIMRQGLNYQLERLKGSIETAAISIGKELAPSMMVLIKMAQGAVEWFNQLSPTTKRWIANLALLATAAGVLVTALGGLGLAVASISSGILTIVSAVSSAQKAFALMKGYMLATGAEATAFSAVMKTAWSAMLGPIGWVVAAVAAFALAYSTNFAGIKDITDGFLEFIQPALTDLGKWFDGVANTITLAFKGAFTNVKIIFMGIEEIIKNSMGVIGNAMAVFGLAIRGEFGAAKEAAIALGESLKGIGSGISKVVLPGLQEDPTKFKQTDLREKTAAIRKDNFNRMVGAGVALPGGFVPMEAPKSKDERDKAQKELDKAQSKLEREEMERARKLIQDVEANSKRQKAISEQRIASLKEVSGVVDKAVSGKIDNMMVAIQSDAKTKHAVDPYGRRSINQSLGKCYGAVWAGLKTMIDSTTYTLGDSMKAQDAALNLAVDKHWKEVTGSLAEKQKAFYSTKGAIATFATPGQGPKDYGHIEASLGKDQMAISDYIGKAYIGAAGGRGPGGIQGRVFVPVGAGSGAVSGPSKEELKALAEAKQLQTDINALMAQRATFKTDESRAEIDKEISQKQTDLIKVNTSAGEEMRKRIKDQAEAEAAAALEILQTKADLLEQEAALTKDSLDDIQAERQRSMLELNIAESEALKDFKGNFMQRAEIQDQFQKKRELAVAASSLKEKEYWKERQSFIDNILSEGQQTEIDMMEEGIAKELASFDFTQQQKIISVEKSMADIEELYTKDSDEYELLELRKTQLTEAGAKQRIKILEDYADRQANAMRDMAEANLSSTDSGSGLMDIINSSSPEIDLGIQGQTDKLEKLYEAIGLKADILEQKANKGNMTALEYEKLLMEQEALLEKQAKIRDTITTINSDDFKQAEEADKQQAAKLEILKKIKSEYDKIVGLVKKMASLMGEGASQAVSFLDTLAQGAADATGKFISGDVAGGITSVIGTVLDAFGQIKDQLFPDREKIELERKKFESSIIAADLAVAKTRLARRRKEVEEGGDKNQLFDVLNGEKQLAAMAAQQKLADRYTAYREEKKNQKGSGLFGAWTEDDQQRSLNLNKKYLADVAALQQEGMDTLKGIDKEANDTRISYWEDQTKKIEAEELRKSDAAIAAAALTKDKLDDIEAARIRAIIELRKKHEKDLDPEVRLLEEERIEKEFADKKRKSQADGAKETKMLMLSAREAAINSMADGYEKELALMAIARDKEQANIDAEIDAEEQGTDEYIRLVQKKKDADEQASKKRSEFISKRAEEEKKYNQQLINDTAILRASATEGQMDDIQAALNKTMDAINSEEETALKDAESKYANSEQIKLKIKEYYAAKRADAEINAEKQALEETKKAYVNKLNELMASQQKQLKDQLKPMQDVIKLEESRLKAINKQVDARNKLRDQDLESFKGADQGEFSAKVGAVDLEAIKRQGLTDIHNPDGVKTETYDPETQKEAMDERLKIMRQENEAKFELEEISLEQYRAKQIEIAAIQAAFAKEQLKSDRLTNSQRAELLDALADAYREFKTARIAQINEAADADVAAKEKEKQVHEDSIEVQKTGIEDLTETAEKNNQLIQNAIDATTDSQTKFTGSVLETIAALKEQYEAAKKLADMQTSQPNAISAGDKVNDMWKKAGGFGAPSTFFPATTVPKTTSPWVESTSIPSRDKMVADDMGVFSVPGDDGKWYRTSSEMDKAKLFKNMLGGSFVGNFKDGGTVPGGFPNDTGFAAVTSGEEIFRAGAGRGGDVNITLTGNTFKSDIDVKRALLDGWNQAINFNPNSSYTGLLN